MFFFLNFVSKGGKFLIFFSLVQAKVTARDHEVEHFNTRVVQVVVLFFSFGHWTQSFVSTFGQNAHVLLLNYTYKKLKQTENKFLPGQITVTTQSHLSTKDSRHSSRVKSTSSVHVKKSSTNTHQNQCQRHAYHDGQVRGR